MVSRAAPPHLPQPLRATLADATFQQVTIGMSGANVFRVRRGPDTCFLKCMPQIQREEAVNERRRLEWLAGRLPVPEVVAWAEDQNFAYLLTSAIAGHDAAAAMEDTDPQRIVEALAAGMRLWHSQPLDDCPFDHSIGAELERAHDRVLRGAVDPEEFEEENRVRGIAATWQQLMATRPADQPPVLTHGDYCLPNIMLQQGRLTGFVDLGRAGRGDPYRDLALAARSLVDNDSLGPAWVPELFAAYGLPHLDPAHLTWFQLLDEFF